MRVLLPNASPAPSNFFLSSFNVTFWCNRRDGSGSWGGPREKKKTEREKRGSRGGIQRPPKVCLLEYCAIQYVRSGSFP